MLILGIETSCDETAIAIVRDGKEILYSSLSSQLRIHKRFGGVVPELASRAHLESISPLLKEVLRGAKSSFRDMDGIAVTYGPGLVGALLIGVALGKSISFTLRLPWVGINHIEAHLYANFLSHSNFKFPLIGLVVSGGHTALFYMKELGKYELLGRTLDDAAGEAFDKVAKLLGLGYPGGPIIDRVAKDGNGKRINFPRPYLGKESLDFSFSGLKTSVLYYLRARGWSLSARGVLQRRIRLGRRSAFFGGGAQEVKDIAASFQAAVVDVLVEKVMRAAKIKKVKGVLLGGGVAVNSLLRREMRKRAEEGGLKVYFPTSELCTDNAAMVAGLGFIKLQAGERASLSLNADPNLSLGSREQR